MKFFSAQLLGLMKNRVTRRNAVFIFRFFVVFLLLITAYTAIFHYLMAREGQSFSLVTGFYWTLTVMSTLGFGDITFHSDVGRIFSIVVLLSGTLLMLVLLPFTFIQFFYEPWMAAQAAARAPRQLEDDVEGHVILTSYDEVSRTLIQRLNGSSTPYVLVVPDLTEALRLHDLEVDVMLGEIDDPLTYTCARIEKASLLATTASDTTNTNIAFIARQLAPDLPIVTTANDKASLDILRLAGSTHTLRLAENMGKALARRVIAGDAMAHSIGNFDDLLIAEATAANTPLAGKTLAESKLRENVNVGVVGMWEKGEYLLPEPHAKITNQSVLLLAGSREQINNYNELFCIYNTTSEPVIIIGGGRVGRAVGRALTIRGVDYRIVEKLPERVKDPEKYIIGSAAEKEVLEQAGIAKAPTVIITTHDDDMNIYLTIYCRQLRPDIQIIGRATEERNITALHRAGCDAVMSYSSMGANAILNTMKHGHVVMVAEGLEIFSINIPSSLVGKSILQSNIRQKTGCTITALKLSDGMHINPDPNSPLPETGQLIMIGSYEAEDLFRQEFCRRKSAQS